MIALRLGALAALAVVLFGQGTPKDVDGWDNIKWGMTMAEARSVYHVDSEPVNKDEWTLLELKPVQLAGVEMGVQVGAREGAEKISLVRLWSFFGLPSSPPSARPQDFDTLKATLIRKYGQPAKEEVRQGGENTHYFKTALWTFPSTSILLSLEQSSALPNLGTIYLEYTATGK
jgi:hypothetical protein